MPGLLAYPRGRPVCTGRLAAGLCLVRLISPPGGWSDLCHGCLDRFHDRCPGHKPETDMGCLPGAQRGPDPGHRRHFRWQGLRRGAGLPNFCQSP